MAEFGALALLTRCVNSVTGINANTYSAETTCEEVLTVDECGNNAHLMTKNVTTNHEWEGEVKGPGASGIATVNVGTAFSPPSGVWVENQASPGSSYVANRARYNEQAGEYAKFSATLVNREGI